MKLTESKLRQIVREELLRERAISPREVVTVLNRAQVVGAARVDDHEIMLTLDDGRDLSIRAEHDGIVGYIN